MYSATTETNVQHKPDSGMCSRTTWSRPRPRPGVFEAKARGLRGQGQGASRPRPRPQNFVLEVYSRSRPVLEDPHTWALFIPRDATQRAVMPSRLSVHHSQIQRPTAASCALVYELWSIVFMVLSPLLTILKNSTSYGQISKPKSRPSIVEAKAKARDLRGQGHKILSSRLRPVLEDPIPDQTWSQGHHMQGQGQGLDLQGQGLDLQGQGQGLDLQGQGQGLNSRGQQGGLPKRI